jgi:hypothetical protein
MAGNAPELQKIGGVFTFLTNIITNVKTARFRAVFYFMKKTGARRIKYTARGEIISGVKNFQG